MSQPSRSVLILMPALNEEEAVGQVVKEALAALPEAEVLVVDDGSTDRTAEVARAAGATVLEMPFHLGVGGAIRAGLRYSLAAGFDVTVEVDADGQHDPRQVDLLLGQLEGGDRPEVVIGSRFAGGGQWEASRPRRWAMRLLAACMSRLTGTRLTDVTSGFRAYNRAAVALLERSYPAEWLLDLIESLLLAHRAGARIVEVPVDMRPRQGGRPSQSALSSAVYLLRVLFALLLSLIRR
jgi:glycosyltransferase involved in cell wall biosynthesis